MADEQEPISVILTMDDAFVDDPAVRDAVVESSRRAGLDVRKILARSGVVTGLARRDDLAGLRKLAHVVSVDLNEKRSI